jgi:hypothetical protein
MVQRYSLIGPNLYVDQRGILFEKNATDYKPVNNKYTQAEDRYVQRNLSKGVFTDEKN